jgi:hypothetical protein
LKRDITCCHERRDVKLRQLASIVLCFEQVCG